VGIAAAIRADPVEFELKPASPIEALLQRGKTPALQPPPKQASAERRLQFVQLLIGWGGWPRQAPWEKG
jgi:hypothetical protein